MAPSARRRRLRWLAPVVTAAVIALLAAAPGLSSAAPSLPAITAQQLLVKVQQANVTALSGTIDLDANLGIPDLSELNDAAGDGGSVSGTNFSPVELLTGSHQALVWIDGATRQRVDLLESSAETDLIHNGADVWLWDSTTKTVTHQTLAPHTDTKGTKGPAEPSEPPAPMKTPQQLADDLLAQITPSTAVSVASNVRVAGRSAYQLMVAPHAATSTIDHINIAVDSSTGLPLRVQVFSKSQTSAVLTLGFGSVHFSTPSASEFAFSAPPGAKVTTGNISDNVLPGANGRQQVAQVKMHHVGGHRIAKGVMRPPTLTPLAVAGSAGTKETEKTVGQDWTSVAIISNVQLPGPLSSYFSGGTAVTGAFGSGRIIGSPLINVLVLNDGRMAVGAVSPAALEAAVATAAP